MNTSILSQARLFAAIVLLAAAASLHAQAVIGTDNASASAYASGWTNGSAGSITGPGAYGQWFLNTNLPSAAYTIASAAGVGDTNSAVIDSSGVSFRLSGTNAEATAFRFIDPAGLGAGQTFSIQMAVNFRDGFKGMDLRGDTIGDPTIFNLNIGGDDYVVSNAASGNGSIGNSYSSFTIFTLSFTQIDGTGGSWSLDRSGGVISTTNGTYSGVARSIKLYNSAGNALPENALFVNNLETVPEPSTLALLMLGGVAAWGWCRRRAGAHR